MDFIIGGAYQGKREYAQNRFSLTEKEIFTCREDGKVDWSARCIAGLEELAFWCVRSNVNAVELFGKHADEWRDSVLICTDISCGVVPLGTENRAWREETGRLCAYLAGEARTVTRMFCGIAGRLK